jgi:hypothetical protein
MQTFKPFSWPIPLLQAAGSPGSTARGWGAGMPRQSLPPTGRRLVTRARAPLAICVGLAAFNAACGDNSGPTPPDPIEISVTAVGSLHYSDGAPVVGATVYKYPTLLSPGEASTKSNATGDYSLTFTDRCFPDGRASGVGITPPVTPPTGGGECTGEMLCRIGTQRRDCTFQLATQ